MFVFGMKLIHPTSEYKSAVSIPIKCIKLFEIFYIEIQTVKHKLPPQYDEMYRK